MSRPSFDRNVTVVRHIKWCAALRGSPCDCQTTEVEVIPHARVCSTCGGELTDRRRAFCSKSCKTDKRIASKGLAERHARTEEYLARGP